MTGDTAMQGRILRAIGAEGVGQLLNVAVRLLLVPLFLAAWGPQKYGEWLILTAVAGWFSLADLGGQLYYINRMTEAWARDKLDEFQKIFSTGVFFFGVSSAVLMSLAAVLLAVPTIPKWLGIQSTGSDVVYWVLIIMCLRVLVSLPLGLLLGVYRATGAQATSVMYGNLMLLVQLIAGTAVLLSNGGMVLMALTEVVGLFVVSSLVIFDLRRRMPAGRRLFWPFHPQMSILRESWSPSLHFLGIQLAMAVMIQGSVIVVAKAMGPLEVVVFSIMRTIANLVSRFLGMMAHSAWPEFTRLHGQGETQGFQALFRSIFLASTLVGLLYLGLVQLFGKQLFELWLGKQLPYENQSMLLMGALVVFTNHWTLGGNLLMATNRHHDYARVQLPVNMIALSAAYLGGRWLGIEGFIGGLFFGQSVPMIVLTIWMLGRNGWWAASRYLGIQAAIVVVLLPLYLNQWSAVLVTVGVLVLGAWVFWPRKAKAND